MIRVTSPRTGCVPSDWDGCHADRPRRYIVNSPGIWPLCVATGRTTGTRYIRETQSIVLRASGIRDSSLTYTSSVNSGGSRISQRGGAKVLFWPKFAENCMKMKKIGRNGKGVRREVCACPNFYYVDPPLVRSPVQRVNINH